MRRFFATLILILNIGLLWSVAQGTRNDLFDRRKVDQELEIMKGILGTTLDFAVRDLRTSGSADAGEPRHLEHALGWNNISGFYLYGQGATFVIPTSELAIPWRRPGRIAVGFSHLDPSAYEEAIAAAQEGMVEAQAELADIQEEFREQMEETAEAEREAREAADTVAAPPPPPAPAPAVAPAAPARPARPAVRVQPPPKPDQEALRQKLAQAQEKVKKRQEALEQRRQKFQEALAQLKVHLVDALANHGDSLTFVKPNEYINLVLSTDLGEAMILGGGGASQRDIVSVQKSVVSDYKAGRLTLDAFRQKVLQYSN